MLDEVYRNSFKEVYYILQNSETQLLERVPVKFMNFLKSNMNPDFKTNISLEIPLNKQPLLKETEDILSLVYRSYFATNEEKEAFAIKDKQEFLNLEQNKRQNYPSKDIYKVFEERQNIDNIKIDNSLIVIRKENFIQKLFNKILKLFKK